MTTQPVYLIGNFPEIGFSRSTDWTSVCNKGEFVFISYHQYRDTSRWVHVERARKYIVHKWVKGRFGYYIFDWSSHYTLEAAEKAAAALVAKKEAA